MEYYDVLLPLALILVMSKLFCIGCRKIGAPQVVGMLLTGLIIGFAKYTPLNDLLLSPSALNGVGFIAKIGVILIMFSAGLETDVKKIKQTGIASIVITLLGVIVPLGIGFLISGLFFGFSSKQQILQNLFYGTILTATSVSVTIATLKELGKLDTNVGTSIVSAAILDDIIGVIVLSFIIGLTGTSASSNNPLANGICSLFRLDNSKASSPWMVCILTLFFFVFVFLFGFLIRKLFKYLDEHDQHHRRLPIFGLSICFLFAFCSEKFFGVADITGAFFAGLVLASSKQKNYIDRRSEIVSYLIFTPVFFANIGMTMEFKNIEIPFIGFGLLFVLGGIAGKVVGCGVGGKICKYTFKESLRVGFGMMARAEVCLICAQKGVDSGLISSSIMPFILLLIVITSFITPVLLKLTYKGELGIVEAQVEEKDKSTLINQ